MEEIEECHSHLQSHKIAYFGINDKQDEPSKPPTGPVQVHTASVACTKVRRLTFCVETGNPASLIARPMLYFIR